MFAENPVGHSKHSWFHQALNKVNEIGEENEKKFLIHRLTLKSKKEKAFNEQMRLS
jgi:hypothetical protein